MSIIRVRKDANYFTASNEPFNDTRMSWETRGLMGYLLSKPNNWQVRAADLVKKGPAGSRKIKRMLAEARLYGYMNRIRIKLKNGKFDWVTEVFESPSQNPSPSKSFLKSSGAKCTTANCTGAKPTDIVITEGKSTELVEEDGALQKNVDQLKTLYEQNIGAVTPLLMNLFRNAALTYSADWFRPAFEITVKSAKHRSWAFVESVLQSWKDHGYGWKPGNEKPVRSNGSTKDYSKPPEDDNFMAELEAKKARLRAEKAARMAA